MPNDAVMAISDNLTFACNVIFLVLGLERIVWMMSSTYETFSLDVPCTSVADIAGMDEAMSQIMELIEIIKKPETYKRLGAKVPRSILFQGPPGEGKTMLATAFARETGLPIVYVSCYSESDIHEVFKRVKKSGQHTVVVLDNIDALQRDYPILGSIPANILLVATSRKKVVIDRFDKIINVMPSNLSDRIGIIKRFIKESNQYIEYIALRTGNVSRADLVNLLNEMAIIATKHGHDEITQGDFEEALHRKQNSLSKIEESM